MLILLGQQYVANMNIYPGNRVIVMACRLSSGGVLLGPAEEATSCRGGNQQKWLQTTPVPMCHTTPVPFHTILYQTKNTHYHTILALGFTKAYIYAMPHTTTPISKNICKPHQYNTKLDYAACILLKVLGITNL